MSNQSGSCFEAADKWIYFQWRKAPIPQLEYVKQIFSVIFTSAVLAVTQSFVLFSENWSQLLLHL